MRLSVAFKIVQFGSHEWCGGFSFIHPSLQLWEGTSVSPGSSQWLQLAVLVAQHI